MVDANGFEIVAIKRVIMFATDELPTAVSMVNHEPDRPLSPEDVATDHGEDMVQDRLHPERLLSSRITPMTAMARVPSSDNGQEPDIRRRDGPRAKSGRAQ